MFVKSSDTSSLYAHFLSVQLFVELKFFLHSFGFSSIVVVAQLLDDRMQSFCCCGCEWFCFMAFTSMRGCPADTFWIGQQKRL